MYNIIGAAMSLYNEIGSGYSEPIYQECLSVLCSERDIPWEREKMLKMYFHGIELEKTYKADFVCYDDIIVELKSVTKLIPAHRAQLCNYLRLTRKPLGLLLNFGEESLIGERWAYDADTNECFIVDRSMEPIAEADYSYLLDVETGEEN